MSDLWTYRAEMGTTTADVAGFDVEATDGEIGKVDEATNEAGSSYIVVDTGFWIFGKKRLIPARTIQRVDLEDGKVYVGMTKEQIKDAPDYDEMRRDREDYRTTVGDYYSRF